VNVPTIRIAIPIQQHHRRLADILAGFETCNEESVVEELLLNSGSSPL
jgi:hypothetical protein